MELRKTSHNLVFLGGHYRWGIIGVINQRGTIETMGGLPLTPHSLWVFLSARLRICPSMPVIDAKEVAVDDTGYLICEADWNRHVAIAIAHEDGCELSEDHWEVIDFLREYYAEHRATPAMRVLTQAMAARLGHSKGNTRYLYQLYPLGPTKQATRYAGLPKPRSCI